MVSKNSSSKSKLRAGRGEKKTFFRQAKMVKSFQILEHQICDLLMLTRHYFQLLRSASLYVGNNLCLLQVIHTM